MRSQTPKPAALEHGLLRRSSQDDRSQERHPGGVSFTVGQTQPKHRTPSSLFHGDSVKPRMAHLAYLQAIPEWARRVVNLRPLACEAVPERRSRGIGTCA